MGKRPDRYGGGFVSFWQQVFSATLKSGVAVFELNFLAGVMRSV